MEDISYNFGAIRDTIIKLSASEILKESKSKTLDSFMVLVKKNPILNKQHLFKCFKKNRGKRNLAVYFHLFFSSDSNGF